MEKRETEVFDVAVIGGGAAGLFAGCFLKKAGASFVILERTDEAGKKLLLTGHGRCNITNRKAAEDPRRYYREAGSFIYRALSRFTPEDTIRFIEDELHVPLKEEEDGRMFPVSDSSRTIRDALVAYIGSENILTGFDCTDIDEGFTVTSAGGRSIRCKKLIIAAGGRSYPGTGSDGSSYQLAKKQGHTVTPLFPALTSVTVSEEDRELTSSLSGVSVNAGASLYVDSKKKAGGTGDVLFTHKGLSGPVIYELNREIPRDVVSRDGWIELDFTPGRTDEEVDAELLESMKAHTDSKLTTLASQYVPSSVASALGKRAGVTDIYAGRCDRRSRKELIRALKHLGLKIAEPPPFETAYVTRGGVALRELRRKSMESKIAGGLYLIGEYIDVDGASGGYNLQACISEAFIAVDDIMS